VARFLVLGGGSCRALTLARSLTAEGHAVRAVTRSEDRRAAIEETGAECWIGSPDVVGTLRYALDNVTLLCHFLGHVDDPDLHGSRLHMLLERTIDTTVRGVIYEAGPGLEVFEHMTSFNEIPSRVVPADASDWQAVARSAVDELLAHTPPTTPV
jgi:NAD(P)-dependent dehydrogenase (short-subunit alcohol dehydrogenase family)